MQPSDFMRAHGVLVGEYRSELDDGRGHDVTVDLPTDEDGSDQGTSALELNVESFAGCILTIFALVARRRKVPVDRAEVTLEAERPKGSKTITRVAGTFRVASPATSEEVATALAITLRTCPVGVLYERAGIPVDVRLEMAS